MRGIGARGLSATKVSTWHNNSSTLVSIPSRKGPPPLTVTSGLILRIAADALTGLADGAVLPATITDLSGVGNTATKTGSPTYKTVATPNQGPCLKSAVSGYYSFPAGMWTGKTAGHLFGYVKHDRIPIDVVSGPWWFSSSAAEDTYFQFSNTNFYTLDFRTSRTNFLPNRTFAQTWRVLDIASGAGTWTATIDGVSQLSNSHAFSVPTNNWILRGRQASDPYMYMAEFLAYDRVLNASEAMSVREYLIGRHGETG